MQGVVAHSLLSGADSEMYDPMYPNDYEEYKHEKMSNPMDLGK